MKTNLVVCSVLLSLVACGGTSGGTSSSSSSSSTSSSSSSSSSSSNSSGSSSSSSSSSGDFGGVPTTLTGITWELRYLESNVGVRRASNKPVTIRFNSDRQLEGASSCGPFTSKFWVRHDAIGLDRATELKLNCPPSPWSLLEHEFYAALNSLSRFSVGDAELNLFAGDDAVLVFESIGEKCETPKIIAGEPPLISHLSPIGVLLTSDQPIDQLLHRLEADYPDLALSPRPECGMNDLAVVVNQVTLQYLRCRSDIRTITYQ